MCLTLSEFQNIAYRKNPGIPPEKLGVFSKSSIDVCGSCGTGQIDPPCKSEDLREFYEQLFSANSPRSSMIKRGVYARTAHQFLTFKDFIDIKDMSVIEIGSNDAGWFKLCRLYRAEEYSYFDSIRSSYIDKRGGVFLGFLSSEKISEIKSESTDLIVASHSLEHLMPGEIRTLLLGMKSILKSQTGLIFIEIPIELDDFDMRTLTPPHTLFFTVQGLTGLLENVGFDILGMHLIKGHKFGRYKSLNRSFLRRLLSYLMMKYFLSEKVFPDAIVNLSSSFYPRSEFDYVRVLVQNR